MKKSLKSLAMVVFQISMPLFMLLGLALVGIQLISIFMGSGSQVVWAKKTLYPLASTASSICMFAAFIYSYVKKA